ncbi:M23 family metallopeptidase [Candidatus Woesearchaeota archaeon]|nr:M23 family metallopeptidase [Candidatus Woesearchaeota archaeon]
MVLKKRSILSLCILISLILLISGCIKHQDNTTSFGITLPVNSEDIVFEYEGIWPFGIQGGDHPHGHPGIDFQAREGSPIFAVDDGIIDNMDKMVGEYKEQSITLKPDNYKEHIIHYTGSMNDIQVKEGDRVKRGDIIAYYRIWIEFQDSKERVGHIHFEFHEKTNSQGGALCGYDFMTEEAKLELDELFIKATYDNKEQYPLICNSCPEGGCY